MCSPNLLVTPLSRRAGLSLLIFFVTWGFSAVAVNEVDLGVYVQAQASTFPAPYKILHDSLRFTASKIKITGVPMAIYRTLYYTDVSVGVGGRVTIPQDMREDQGIDEGDALTVRVEENPRGGRQMVIWRTEQQPGDED